MPNTSKSLEEFGQYTPLSNQGEEVSSTTGPLPEMSPKVSKKKKSGRKPIMKHSEGRIEDDCARPFEEIVNAPHKLQDILAQQKISGQTVEKGVGKVSKVSNLHSESVVHLPARTDVSKKDDQLSNDATTTDTTDGLPDSGYLVPPSITQAIDHTGGDIILGGTSISLKIPPGALPEGSTEDITLSLGWNIQDDGYNGSECNSSPVIRCEPTGLQFLKPVTLTSPHCAVLKDPSKTSIKCLYNEKDAGKEFFCLLLSSRHNYSRSSF